MEDEKVYISLGPTNLFGSKDITGSACILTQDTNQLRDEIISRKYFNPTFTGNLPPKSDITSNLEFDLPDWNSINRSDL